MAALGTATLLSVPTLLAATDFQIGAMSIAYGAATVLPVPALVAATAYTIGGATPCPPSGPTVPTAGQIWPRGNP